MAIQDRLNEAVKAAQAAREGVRRAAGELRGETSAPSSSPPPPTEPEERQR